MEAILQETNDVVLMQCNTNYTASIENFKYINLNVLKSYRNMYPGVILGLSDHTLGCTTVLGAVALGARVIEKHFTDDRYNNGPDHAFSMDPNSWRDMVDKVRELESALGSGVKKVEDNESETVILQRRSIRVMQDLKAGSIINKKDIEVLRPCPKQAVSPNYIDQVIGSEIVSDVKKGECLYWKNLK
jgi:N-acetylneuraminate synthase